MGVWGQCHWVRPLQRDELGDEARVVEELSLNAREERDRAPLLLHCSRQRPVLRGVRPRAFPIPRLACTVSDRSRLSDHPVRRERGAPRTSVSRAGSCTTRLLSAAAAGAPSTRSPRSKCSRTARGMISTHSHDSIGACRLVHARWRSPRGCVARPGGQTRRACGGAPYRSGPSG